MQCYQKDVWQAETFPQRFHTIQQNGGVLFGLCQSCSHVAVAKMNINGLLSKFFLLNQIILQMKKNQYHERVLFFLIYCLQNLALTMRYF